MPKKATRKTPVRWSKAEIKSIVLEILPIMEQNGVKFPIGEDAHIQPKKFAVTPLVLEAQKNILPADRRIGSFLSPALQHTIRKSLNYYHFKNLKAARQMGEAAQPVNVVTGASGDPKALGEMVGSYLSTDRKALESFLIGIISALSTK